jgi:hypothetical protein
MIEVDPCQRPPLWLQPDLCRDVVGELVAAGTISGYRWANSGRKCVSRGDSG